MTKLGMIPKVLLSNYTKKIMNGEIPKGNKPFEGAIRFVDWSYIDSIEILEQTLKKFKGQYYIEKVPTRTLLVHFWDMHDL
jgi:hypothetical protein